ncbi:MAG: hypothetical protein EON60_09300 [Alphaproteobacteria bacterium]|nr:MAG: hypothetical protein EON60_09300 [Alphaproteobacteria bacterium]
MAKPTTSKTKVSGPSTAAGSKAIISSSKAAVTPGLHYNKDDLHADYTQTYGVFMKMLAIGIGGALVYFFIMIVYLGAIGHTPGDDYVREFGSRIQYDYKGLRLPQYDDPSILSKPAQ